MENNQKHNGAEVAENPSTQNADDGRPSTTDAHEPGEQKVILLPRKAYDPNTFWIGVLAKYFDIWVPTSPVKLKENGAAYSFDFYSEQRSKLVKIFTIEDEKSIRSYLDLPYAQHILFILDKDTDSFDLDCCHCCDCYQCNYVDELADEMGAYICHRKDTNIN